MDLGWFAGYKSKSAQLRNTKFKNSNLSKTLDSNTKKLSYKVLLMLPDSYVFLPLASYYIVAFQSLVHVNL